MEDRQHARGGLVKQYCMGTQARSRPGDGMWGQVVQGDCQPGVVGGVAVDPFHGGFHAGADLDRQHISGDLLGKEIGSLLQAV